MSRITIVPSDNNVLVDGETRIVDMTGIDPAIHAVQWFDTEGEIEYTRADGRRNEQINSISRFQVFIDRWTAAEPPPPTLDELKVSKNGKFVIEGINRIAAQVPDWDTLDIIKTISGLWVTHLAANATPAQLKAKDIYLFVRDTVPPKINAATDQAALDAMDPSAADPFGDGTLWPV